MAHRTSRSAASQPVQSALDVGDPIDPHAIARLAERYSAHGMYDEAVHLFEMACKLIPGSVGIQINLARARDLARRNEESRYAGLRDRVAADRSRDEIESAQYIGLAEYYLAKDQTTKAIELLEIARLKTPSNYRAFEILARLHYSHGEWSVAHSEAAKARSLNPFDRGLAELAGRIEFELENLDASLDAFIDAFLLSTDQKGESSEPVRRMISTLKRILTLDTKQLNARIKTRVENLQKETERLELKKENLFRYDGRGLFRDISAKVSREAELRDNLIQLSGDLRQLSTFRHMKDEQLFKLARFVRRVDLDEGDYLFRENDRSMDFFVIRDGTIEIRKETPFGPQLLAALERDEVVGEMNFIDRTHRSTDAIATATSACLGFSFSALDEMMDQDKELAVGLHWSFWRSLTEKIRDANEQLKLFFQEDAQQVSRKTAEAASESQEVRVRSDEKVDLFRERGLSAAEMKLLATFSNEERFRAGSTIFREGDTGDKLYIVLDGRVRISKFIPGVGEEALAVLDRGDFFGEMALIDEKPRSADAKAHETATTVLSIDRATLNEILSMDPHASLQFLNLLCRMITRRLREINDKIVQWKYMAGGF